MPALPELAQFVVPMIQGSVHQISDLQLVTPTADFSGSLTLVARRSSQRPGVRHWRRGAAPDVSPVFSTLIFQTTCACSSPHSTAWRGAGSQHWLLNQAKVFRAPQILYSGRLHRAQWQTLWRQSRSWSWRRGTPASRTWCLPSCRSAAASRCCGARSPMSSTSPPHACLPPLPPSPPLTPTSATFWSPTRCARLPLLVMVGNPISRHVRSVR